MIIFDSTFLIDAMKTPNNTNDGLIFSITSAEKIFSELDTTLKILMHQHKYYTSTLHNRIKIV